MNQFPIGLSPPRGVVDRAPRFPSCRHCRMQHSISATAARAGRMHRYIAKGVVCLLGAVGMFLSSQTLVMMAAMWWCPSTCPVDLSMPLCPTLSHTLSLSLVISLSLSPALRDISLFPGRVHVCVCAGIETKTNPVSARPRPNLQVLPGRSLSIARCTAQIPRRLGKPPCPVPSLDGRT